MRNDILNTIIIHNDVAEAKKIEKLVSKLYEAAVVSFAKSIDEAQPLLKNIQPDLILLSESTIENTHYDIYKDLRAFSACEGFMIILLTSNFEESHLKNIINNVYDGYLANPIEEMSLSIQIQLSLKIKKIYNEKSKESIQHEEIKVQRIAELKENERSNLQLLKDLQKEVKARKKSEDELRASEIRLSRAEIASKSGNWELDINTGVFFVSLGAAAIYGCNKSVISKDIVRSAALEDYHEILDKAMNNLIAKNTAYRVDYKIKRNDNGNISDIRSTAAYDKKTNKVYGVIRDITEEVRTQEALHQSDSLYKAILEASPDDITITDLNGNVLMFSKSVLKAYGFKNEQEVEGQNIKDYIAAEDLSRLSQDFEQLENGIHSGPNEYKSIKKDGTTFDIEVKSGLIRDYNGDIARLLFIARNITERKRIEKKILKSEAELRTVWDYSPIGLALVDENGNIVRVNNSLIKIFEKSDHELEGKSINEIVPSNYKDQSLEAYKKYFQNKSFEKNMEMEFDIHPNRTKWLKLDFAFLSFDKENPLFLTIVNDITDRKLANDKIKNLTRLYSLFGQINQAIVRQKNEFELMKQICDVTIKYGEFKFAWFAEFKTTNNSLKFICESGKNNNYIEKIEDQFDKLKFESKTYRNLIKNKEIAYCNDISQDKEMMFSVSAALENDFHSMAILPIKQSDTAKYLFYLYSDQKYFFNLDEQKLLTKIAEDISYAIETIETEKIRVKTENALFESENRYNAFINNNVDMIFVKDSNLRYLIVNDVFVKFLGIKKEQILNKTNKEFTDNDRYIACLKSDNRALNQDTPLIVLEEIDDRIFETTKFKMPLKDGQFGIGGIMRDITHRKKQEIALEESRLELQSIYDNAPILMCVIDENKSILFQNEEFKRFFNLPDHTNDNISLHEIMGCGKKVNQDKLCDEPDYENCIIRKAIEKTFSDGSTVKNFEHHSSKYVNGIKEEFYLLGSCSIINSSGTRKVLVTFNDITDRKFAETELSQTINRFELAMNVANMAWWEVNLKTNKIYFGRRKAELLGYAPEHFTCNEDFYCLIHPDDQQTTNVCFENHLKGYSDKAEVEYRIRTKDGKYKYFYDIGSISQRSSSGEPLVISGMILDITDRKISDEALEKSEVFLRTFINNTPFQIWARDENNIGILENKMLVDNFGSILGKKPTSDTSIPHELAVNWEKQNSSVLQGEIIDEEIEFIRNGSTLNYQQIIFPINLNGKVIGIAGFTIDISERKKSQHALRESQEELKKFAGHLQHVREEERVALSREIHDELGQILVAIKFDLGMLKQKALKSADNQEVEIYTHLNMLVDNTLQTARRIMTDLRPELLDMLGFVDALKSHIKLFINRQNIECVFESEITDLQIDSQRSVALFRIFQESLNNISKHAKATKIVIKLEQLGVNQYFLEITDNGIGFDLTKKPRSDSYGLLGMRERAYLLDAKLIINSIPKKGTSIGIEFQV